MSAVLDMLALKWHTDKFGHHNYTPSYHAMFGSSRERIKKVVEMGIGWTGMRPNCPDYPKAASLHMWRDYFPSATIYGLDIRTDTLVNEERIRSFVCDQSSLDSLHTTARLIGNDIDLFIDDGSHVPADQILTAKTFLPLLANDGIYVIEDVYFPEQLNSVREGLDQFGLHYKIIKTDNELLPDDRLIVIGQDYEH